jgi:thymidylate synthase
MDQINEQLSREIREFPTLELNKDKQSIFDFEMEDIKVVGYEPHPTIKAPIAV